jgi:hypothetical protein
MALALSAFGGSGDLLHVRHSGLCRNDEIDIVWRQVNVCRVPTLFQPCCGRPPFWTCFTAACKAGSISVARGVPAARGILRDQL